MTAPVMLSYKSTARLAGLAYLVVVITGILNLVVIPSQLIVSGDPAATLANIRANPDLMRLGISAGVVCQIAFLIVPVLLFQVLHSFGRIAAALMTIFVVASVPIAFAAISHHMAILALASGEAASGGDAVAEVARQLDASSRALTLVFIFWGLWLAPYGWLVLKSGAIPRVFGLLLMLGCAAYLIDFFATLFAENDAATRIAQVLHLPGTLGEIGSCLWLLIMGAKDKRAP